MSWYLITLLVILSIIIYITMWILTTLAFGRWSKNSDPEWIAVGMFWPIALICVPFLAAILFVAKTVDKYGYKEEDELPRQNIVYTKRLSDTSIEYIRKDALLEWVKEKLNEYKKMDEDFQGDVFIGNRHAFAEVIAKIESL